ncbi:MAG: UbiH/UbiF/VisC/COQ6 family ubiquinone biosynthesis hydroxylase [Gammaproteobacteria bacterium]|nr:UbiH/UbiF/VisC/COQ6 family ubiquinone biosynthesis hydroxylase [Gammaproteobacteria bacterium]MDH5594004.1 UbiH/UbiF/VisC/COQ6 family ubiquinone biosynthesis hydroxylase [Gammaproteobacteria bacterium]
MEHKQDMVIIGAGMVGAALACALAPTGLKITIVDTRPPPQISDNEFDLRVSAITRASQNIFSALDAWDYMQQKRVSPFREMRVWDSQGNGQIHFDVAEIGEDNLGWIVENSIIQNALVDRLTQFNNVKLVYPDRISDFNVNDDAVTIELASGKQLQSRLLVGADGADSTVRKLSGITTRGWSYDQQGLVCTVRTSGHHNEMAQQVFLPTGPLAFLPIGDHTCSIVWSLSGDSAEQMSSLDDEAFLKALQSAFGYSLGTMLEVGPRAVFPLRLQHSTEYVHSRIALIGDAAHAIHPLAGQGVNLGLADAASLADVIQDALEQKRDIGALQVLRKYERWRKGDNLTMMAAMDGFKRLFGSQLFPVTGLRNLGLTLTNNLAPLKNIIMRQAMGLEGDLARLAKPRF